MRLSDDSDIEKTPTKKVKYEFLTYKFLTYKKTEQYSRHSINAYATVNTTSRVILRLLLIQSIPSSRSPPLNLRLFT
jgi:hypothetical protein